ncbi:hypothetical protein [uncultured Shewanella sp.]|nr:hypothetical protein [uncultured Shewanella sp.]
MSALQPSKNLIHEINWLLNIDKKIRRYKVSIDEKKAAQSAASFNEK